MTTIAYRDGVLAADRLVTQNDTRCGFVTKIAAGPKGHVGGVAGAIEDVEIFIHWIEKGCCGKPPVSLYDTPNGLLIKPDGKAFAWSGKPVLAHLSGEFFAEGSGWKFALAAMAMGADARRAVEVAIRFDLSSGGEIDVLRLGESAQ